MSLRHLPRLNGPDSEIEDRPHAFWLRTRFWRFLYIFYSLEVGIFLLFLPWMRLWENNYLLYRYPQFRPILTNSFLKGGVLGLGIVNILIGIQEIVRLRKKDISK
jgi:hypothetical protein